MEPDVDPVTSRHDVHASEACLVVVTVLVVLALLAGVVLSLVEQM